MKEREEEGKREGEGGKLLVVFYSYPQLGEEFKTSSQSPLCIIQGIRAIIPGSVKSGIPKRVSTCIKKREGFYIPKRHHTSFLGCPPHHMLTWDLACPAHLYIFLPPLLHTPPYTSIYLPVPLKVCQKHTENLSHSSMVRPMTTFFGS